MLARREEAEVVVHDLLAGQDAPRGVDRQRSQVGIPLVARVRVATVVAAAGRRKYSAKRRAFMDARDAIGTHDAESSLAGTIQLRTLRQRVESVTIVVAQCVHGRLQLLRIDRCIVSRIGVVTWAFRGREHYEWLLHQNPCTALNVTCGHHAVALAVDLDHVEGRRPFNVRSNRCQPDCAPPELIVRLLQLLLNGQQELCACAFRSRLEVSGGCSLHVRTLVGRHRRRRRPDSLITWEKNDHREREREFSK